jgi:hypothetical protein
VTYAKRGPFVDGGPPAVSAEFLNAVEAALHLLNGAVLDGDSRLSDARTPLAHQHPVGELAASGVASDETFLRGDGTWAAPDGGGPSLVEDGPQGDATLRSIGTDVAPVGPGTASAGTSRQVSASNHRHPRQTGITNAEVSASAGIAESKLSLASDAGAAVPSRRTLGPGQFQAAPGNHAGHALQVYAEDVSPSAGFDDYAGAPLITAPVTTADGWPATGVLTVVSAPHVPNTTGDGGMIAQTIVSAAGIWSRLGDETGWQSWVAP